MAVATKSLSFPHFSLLLNSSKRLSFLSFRSAKCFFSLLLPPIKTFSSTPTPYPLYYDMIISRPSSKYPPTRSKPIQSSDSDSPESDASGQISPELSFEDWVDKKLTQNETHRNNFMNGSSSTNNVVSGESSLEEMDKSKRKYYSKRKKRMYGSDSDDERRKMREKGEFVELKPEVVELRTLHKREEELYFYDTFAFPWEKEKHYKMVYQLEKKYFPDQCLDKAFLEPGQSNSGDSKGRRANARAVKGGKGEEEKGLVFFENGKDGEGIEENELRNDGVKDLSEKKVEEFFKCLKKFPNKDADVCGVDEPFLASRTSGLPPKWDSPAGTVVLVNKPKGESFFLVCPGIIEALNSSAMYFNLQSFSE